MRNYVIGALTLGLVAMAATTPARAITADCNTFPTTALGNALASAVPGDVIDVMGTCKERVEIRTDDLTVQGDGDDVVRGQILVIGAQRVTIQILTIEGDEEPGEGIGVRENSAVTIQNVTVQNITEHGIAVRHGSYALLSQVNVSQCETGMSVTDSGSLHVFDSRSEENDPVGISIDLSSMGVVVGSTIQNNTETGIHVVNGSVVVSEGNTVADNPEGFSFNTGATGRLVGNSITGAEEGVFVGWGSQLRLNGGNTIEGETAIFVRQAIINQRNGDVLKGSVIIDVMSSAEFRNTTITGPIKVVDNSLLQFKDQSGIPDHVTVMGNTTVSRDSGLNFLKDDGEQLVRVVGNITCTDEESSLFAPSSNVTITGNRTGCTGYNNSSGNTQ